MTMIHPPLRVLITGGTSGLGLALAHEWQRRGASVAVVARRPAREGRGAVVLNVSSDAALTPYAGWGAYGASKAALHHLSRIWGEELAGSGVAVLSLDPGDMDTPLHALAVPDADPASLKRPAQAARELADAIAAALPGARA